MNFVDQRLQLKVKDGFQHKEDRKPFYNIFNTMTTEKLNALAMLSIAIKLIVEAEDSPYSAQEICVVLSPTWGSFCPESLKHYIF